ncbi:MAG: chromate transporter [Treponema sp.]|nr:chromate transporter [Treponema sp.]
MIRDLLALFITFFKIGAVTFGGGMAMLPILDRELADKRKWTTSEELLDYYAISQSTPGIIAVNVATFIGFKRRKVAGGIAATLGVVTPSVIIISLIAAFISNFEQIVWVQKALRGINVAVAALLLYSVIGLARKAIKKPWQLLFFVLSFSLIYFLKVHSVFIIVGEALCGILIAWATGGHRGEASGGKPEEAGD